MFGKGYLINIFWCIQNDKITKFINVKNDDCFYEIGNFFFLFHIFKKIINK